MKADIFFFVTTIAVVVVTMGVSVALYYAIKILRNVRSVSDRIEEGSQALEEDLSELRLKVRTGGFSLRLIMAFFRKASRWFGGRRGSRKEKEEDV